MKKITFRETQLVATEVLKQIHYICAAQGYTYYIFYGSLIGAVRHNGVIPWDDDIDIIMPRKDYNDFIAYCTLHNLELIPYKIVTYQNQKDYPHAIARMCDTRYIIKTRNEYDCDMGIFVDIYPLDGLGIDKEQALSIAIKADFYSSMCFLSTRKRYGRDNTKSTRKMIIKFVAYIVAKICGKNYWIKRLEKNASRYTYEESKYVASVMWLSGGEDEIYEREWMKERIELPFEDIVVYAPKEYDKILSHHYGEYMKLPDKKGQAVHHSYETFIKEE